MFGLIGSALGGAIGGGSDAGGGAAPASASSGGPFDSNSSFGGIRQQNGIDPKTALILSAGIIAAVVVYGITRK